MANQVNVFVLEGCLGGNADLKYFESGGAVLRFSLGHSQYVGREQDTNKPLYEPLWYDCEWNTPNAQQLQMKLLKGRSVVVTGEARCYRVMKDGVAIQKNFIRVHAVSFDRHDEQTTQQPKSRTQDEQRNSPQGRAYGAREGGSAPPAQAAAPAQRQAPQYAARTPPRQAPASASEADWNWDV